MFVEAPSFPAALAYGATGGPRYNTDVLVQGGGKEGRNQNWALPRCQWEVGSIHRTQAEIDLLVHFFHAVAQGQTHSFRFRDFTDDTFNNPIGTGDGIATTFQLVKVYTYGAFTSTRVIAKPMAGNLELFVNGMAREDYTPDFTSGLVTFTTAPSDGQVVSASGTFEVPCRFGQDILPITVVTPGIYSCAGIELWEVRLETVG
jgi:uncharacterized protein (TIGR02217 family)